MDEHMLLQEVGLALYGAEWPRPLAQRLVVDDRTMRRWIGGDRLPPGVVAELSQIARHEAAKYTVRAATLKRAAAALGGDGVQRQVGAAQQPGPVQLSPDEYLTDFRVIPTGVWDDPEIRFNHNGKLVLATVTQEAWEDFFPLPDEPMFSSNDARLLAQANLPRLAPIIASRYKSGNYVMVNRAGGTYPLVTLFEADLTDAHATAMNNGRPGMTKEILDDMRARRGGA